MMHGDLVFEGKVFNDAIKTILTPLWNAYHFFTLYANAGKITADTDTNSDNLLDKYILSELNELISTTTKSLEEYKPDRVQNSYNGVEFLSDSGAPYEHKCEGQSYSKDKRISKALMCHGTEPVNLTHGWEYGASQNLQQNEEIYVFSDQSELGLKNIYGQHKADKKCHEKIQYSCPSLKADILGNSQIKLIWMKIVQPC